ncbi:MAG: hypothetical protein IT447_09895 [Phycisphaerales bacterium]|nr:hypothetical protein [Phycisphaerales bacterium]
MTWPPDLNQPAMLWYDTLCRGEIRWAGDSRPPMISADCGTAPYWVGSMPGAQDAKNGDSDTLPRFRRQDSGLRGVTHSAMRDERLAAAP